jgi:hypothetical protein
VQDLRETLAVFERALSRGLPHSIGDELAQHIVRVRDFLRAELEGGKPPES